MPASDLQQRTLRFAGEVQGVGFRYTTKQIADNHPVTGYVSNQDNGEVLLVLEGSPADMEAVVGEIRQHFDGYIQNESQQQTAATGEFTRFEIRR